MHDQSHMFAVPGLSPHGRNFDFTRLPSLAHEAVTVFRAVETRLPMIRCGNNSCSVLINPDGVISDTIFINETGGKYGERKLLPAKKGSGMATFIAKVHPNPPLSFYSRFGDVFILFCWLLFGSAAVISFWNWREKKQALIAVFEPPANNNN